MPAELPYYHLQIHKGTDFQFDFVLRNPDGTLMDISGASFTIKMRYIFAPEISISFHVNKNETESKIIMTLTPEETSSLAGNCIYDVLMTDSLGKKKIVLYGKVSIVNTQSTY